MDPNRPVSAGRSGCSGPTRWLAWAAAVAAYSLLTLIYLRPIWRVWGDRIPFAQNDPLFNLYVLKWSAHQIRLGLPDLWNANLFYPTRGALALSDHLLGPAAQLALFLRIVPNAIAGYNFLFFTAFVATALAVCWICRRMGLSWVAALLAGWMYAFSPFRLSHMTHIQILIAQWAPLTLWLWDRLLAERTAKRAVLFLAAYLLSLSGGCYLAYMIHVPLLVLFANRALAEGRGIVSWRSLRLLVPVGLIAGAAVLVLFLPYLRVARSLRLERTEAEIWKFGATPASYISPSRESFYLSPEMKNLLRLGFGSRVRDFYQPERALFPGLIPTVLFFVGAAGCWRRRREAPLSLWERGIAISGLVCFLLTFPWVYAPLMRVVPGMSGMRVPARFYVFASLALVIFAGRGVDFLRERMPERRSRAALVTALAGALVLELAPYNVRWAPLPREEAFPAVYRWIAREPEMRALIELPIHQDARENQYIYYSTLHWKPLANGYSGYLPPSHERITQRIHFLPDQEGLDLLREMGISHLVIHPDSPRRLAALRDWDAGFASERQVERVYQDEEAWVYRLLPSPTSSRNPKRAGLWKSAGRVRVDDQPLNSGSPPWGRSIR